jgi:hypothetical protein
MPNGQTEKDANAMSALCAQATIKFRRVVHTLHEGVKNAAKEGEAVSMACIGKSTYRMGAGWSSRAWGNMAIQAQMELRGVLIQFGFRRIRRVLQQKKGNGCATATLDESMILDSKPAAFSRRYCLGAFEIFFVSISS